MESTKKFTMLFILIRQNNKITIEATRSGQNYFINYLLYYVLQLAKAVHDVTIQPKDTVVNKLDNL